MSNALAIAAVTAVVRDRLNDGLVNANLSGITGSTVDVTVLPPDQVVTDDSAEGLNLFMYEVTPNSNWRNVGMPSRSGQGDVISSNPLALDLHYLLTAYSSQAYHAEILLGYGMQLLHEMPVLTREGIRRTLSNPLPATVLPPAFRALSGADLADQVEQIKLTYEPMGTEELFRLWSSFQAPYRPTAAYHASVVLIERNIPTKSPIPVLRPNLYVAPLRQPAITQLVALNGVAQSFMPESTLVIRGQNLRGDETRVQVGGLHVSPDRVTNTQLEVPLAPLASAANGLKAGVQTVRVIHSLILGTPADPHTGSASNVAAFILRPTLTVDLEAMTCSGDAEARRCAATVVINTLLPSVGRDQQVMLWLSQLLTAPDEQAQTYTFAAPEHNGITDPTQTETSTMRFPVAEMVPGTYLVRVQVDGADSLPEIDTDRSSATYNQFTGEPQITLGP